MLSILHWDVFVVTPIEYVDFLIDQLVSSPGFIENIQEIDDENVSETELIDETSFQGAKIRNHCKTLIYLCIFGKPIFRQALSYRLH
jgi:hypothetical protein